MRYQDHPAFKEPAKQDLPRICYILGGEDNPLKIGERFEIPHVGTFVVNADGHIVSEDGYKMGAQSELESIINGEKTITRRPQFSEDEKAFMRHCISKGWEEFIRLAGGGLRMRKGESIVILPSDLLPSLTNAISPFGAAAYLESEDK